MTTGRRWRTPDGAWLREGAASSGVIVHGHPICDGAGQPLAGCHAFTVVDGDGVVRHAYVESTGAFDDELYGQAYRVEADVLRSFYTGYRDSGRVYTIVTDVITGLVPVD